MHGGVLDCFQNGSVGVVVVEVSAVDPLEGWAWGGVIVGSVGLNDDVGYLSCNCRQEGARSSAVVVAFHGVGEC